jgi:DNA-binding NtrC family response regulator
MHLDLNILVLEGEGGQDWKEVKKFLGKKKGLDLFSVSSVGDAYRTVQRERINIIIAEYNMPRANMLRFIDKVKKARPHIEIIFLSEHVQLSKAIDAMKAGAYDFYEFPINMRLLMTMVGKAIEKQSLFFEKEKFKEKVEEQFDVSNIIGRSKSMQNVINIVRSVAQKNVNVLITGETGTGKEMIAEAIHYNSDRYEKPFVAVNCGAFNEGVLESELYGHEKGAFTGAISSRIGRFELADGGTIFLDEIGDISHSTQIKLLRVLQEKTFERVGGNEKFQTDARVIAATNRDLKTLIEKKQFRDDLYYRLNVVHIHIPPLKERREDIPLLVSHFINKLNEEKEYGIKGISNGAMQLLRDYSWPGNVRELENAVESAMALAQTDVIEEKYLPSFLLITPADEKSFYRIPSDMTMKEIEGEIIKRTVERASGNKTRAAQMLGIGLRTLQRKTKEMGL